MIKEQKTNKEAIDDVLRKGLRTIPNLQRVLDKISLGEVLLDGPVSRDGVG